MSFFRLNDLYALRRYTNDVPLVIKYGNPSWKMKVSDEEMELLKKCDGVSTFSMNDLSGAEASFLKTMISRNIVQELSNPFQKTQILQKKNHLI